MTWTLQNIEGKAEDGWPMMREIISNHQGVQIEPWGSLLNGYQVFFKYSHDDIAVEFQARRSPEGWIDYDPGDGTQGNFALGPVCRVFIDDRRMRAVVRPLSVDEIKNI